MSEISETLQPHVLKDVLGDLQSAVNRIQIALDGISLKVVHSDSSGKKAGEASSQHESPPANVVTRSPQVPGINALKDTDDGNGGWDWLTAEKIIYFKERCSKHRSECEILRKELGHLFSHCRIEIVETLQQQLLDPVQFIEEALTATSDGRRRSLDMVNDSFQRTHNYVCFFHMNLSPDNVQFFGKLKQWSDSLYTGWSKLYDLSAEDKLLESLEYAHNDFLPDLDAAMSGVTEELMTFGEICLVRKMIRNDTSFGKNNYFEASRIWLANQTNESIEEWCAEHFSFARPGAWPTPAREMRFKDRYSKHQRVCQQFKEELTHLVEHYRLVGADKEVITASNSLRQKLLDPVRCLDNLLNVKPLANGREKAIGWLKCPPGLPLLPLQVTAAAAAGYRCTW